MITTVTLNASIDKSYVVGRMIPGEVMRVREVTNAAGGKGLNVSRVAALAGEPVIATGFAGGHVGGYLLSLMKTPGITPRFTAMEGETRSCINIWDEAAGNSTEFLEPGVPVSEEELDAFRADYRSALEQSDVVTISGSAPVGTPADFYAELIRIAREMDRKVLLDTSGQLLRDSVQAGPALIKPNRDEIRQLTGREVSSREELLAASRELHQGGVACVAVSLGKDGVLITCEEGVFHGITPDIPVVNTVGCGDSMLAGFAVGLARGMSTEEMIRFAVGISTANALTRETGFYRQEDLDRILPMVGVKQVN